MMNDTTALLPDIKLQFNIEHPSYEECYLFGYECALSELSELENPFKEGSHESEQWLEGWWDATYGEKPLFGLNNIEEESFLIHRDISANDQIYCPKNSFLSLVFEIGGAIAASALVGYQLLELVA